MKAGKQRNFRVAVTCYRMFIRPRRARLKHILLFIDRIVESCSPDIILLSESHYDRGFINRGKKPNPIYPQEPFEEIPGPFMDALSKKCVEHNCCIIANQFERIDDEKGYNASVFLDRTGQILHKYLKMYIPDGEVDLGIIAGYDPQAFDTEFGRLGMEICLDMKYPSVSNRIASDGAEMIFGSTIGFFTPEAIETAKRCGVYYAVSGQHMSETVSDIYPSAIIDKSGNILSQVTDRTAIPSENGLPVAPGDGSFCYADIDLDQ